MTRKKPTPKASLVDSRISEQKQQVLEILTKLPVVQAAVKRAGISRATFYRWRDEDEAFNNAVTAAIREGTTSINELAQSRLIEEITKSNMTALIFWLKSRDPLFSDRRTVINEYQLKTPDRPISPEAAEAIDKVFTMFENVAQRLRKQHDQEDAEELALESGDSGLDPDDE